MNKCIISICLQVWVIKLLITKYLPVCCWYDVITSPNYSPSRPQIALYAWTKLNVGCGIHLWSATSDKCAHKLDVLSSAAYVIIIIFGNLLENCQHTWYFWQFNSTLYDYSSSKDLGLHLFFRTSSCQGSSILVLVVIYDILACFVRTCTGFATVYDRVI